MSFCPFVQLLTEFLSLISQRTNIDRPLHSCYLMFVIGGERTERECLGSNLLCTSKQYNNFIVYKHLKGRLQPLVIHVTYRVFFFNWAYPLDWPPQKCLDWPPPKSCKYENHIEVLRYLVFFSSWGGASLGLCRFFEIGYLPADT